MKRASQIVMAFDFGTKNIGIAIGQEITGSSQTFYTVKANQGEPEWTQLDKVVFDWNPKLFIVGDPLNFDGSESDIKEKSDKFSYQIQKKYKIPVKLVDERLTTKEARERIKEGVDMSLRSSNDIHQVSAQIILESWFRISR
ncbi:MAG: Holliday junction resolvase RuvX [Gammaproteobacteria bacterium]